MAWAAAGAAVLSAGINAYGANKAAKAGRVNAPPAPEPVDAGKAARAYLLGMADPDLQRDLINAEGTYRPQNLINTSRDIQTSLIGTSESKGALDFVSDASDRMAALNQRLATQNTEYVLDQLKSYGPEATAAYMAANPGFANAVRQMESLGGRQVSGYLNAMGDLAMQPGTGQQIVARGINAPANVRADQIASGGMLTPQQVQAERVAAERVRAGQVQAGTIGGGALGESLYQQALRGQEMSPVSAALQQQALQMAQAPGGINPEEMRAATQGARERFAGSGRLADNTAIAGEALARAGASRDRQMQDLAAAQQINQQLLGAQQMGQQLATDVLRTDIQRQQANVGNQLQAGQFNVDAMLRGDLANQQTNLQANLANQDAFLRAALANQQAGMQAGMFNIQNTQDVQRLNQMANLQANLANQQMGFNVAQLGSQQDLQAQLANRQFGLDELTARFNRLNTTTGMEQNMLNADRSFANQLANMYGGITPAALGLAGIGRNADAIAMGGNAFNAAMNMSTRNTPELFNLDAGVNLALANNANTANYNAAVAGAQGAAAGAAANATGNMWGNIAKGAGAAAGNINWGSLFSSNTGSGTPPPALAKTGTPWSAPGSGFKYGT